MNFFQAKMEKHEAGLAKMNVAFDSIASFRREVSDLVPKHRAALAEVKDHVDFVEIQREEYIKVGITRELPRQNKCHIFSYM